MTNIAAYIAIGLGSGVIMGFFGLAGGIIIVPGLMYLAGFSQKAASGTNLLVLLVPVSFAAALEYYRSGNADVKAAVVIATATCLSAWFCSRLAARMDASLLRMAFGLFVTAVGIYIVLTTKRAT